MGIFKLPPEETVRQIISMKRWQRNWIRNHRSINFSGLIQMYLSAVIKQQDPDYYEEHKHLLENQVIHQEVIEKIVDDMKNTE